MVRIEDRCCDCCSQGKPCLGSYCPRTRVAVHYCDKCGAELVDICEADGGELCSDCYHEQYGYEED